MVNFVEIPEKSFHTMNKQSFIAVGKGEMVIGVPNGVDVLHLRLMEVLYSPEVRYTLVSVGHLDDNRFSLTFAGGKCTIMGPDGECVSSVPKTGHRLYHVMHEPEVADPAVETLTIDQSHHHMGYISPKIAQKLVKDGFMMGIRLETSSSGDTFCKSCVYAKATRKPVTKA